MDLTTSVALVTGGGSGIGLGVVAALAREGCPVVIAGRGEGKLEKAAAVAMQTAGGGPRWCIPTTSPPAW